MSTPRVPNTMLTADAGALEEILVDARLAHVAGYLCSAPEMDVDAVIRAAGKDIARLRLLMRYAAHRFGSPALMTLADELEPAPPPPIGGMR